MQIANPFAEASFLGILLLFGWTVCHHRHHCTIKQTSVAQRQRTGNRPFYCTDIAKSTGKTFEKASFNCILLLFGYIIVSSPPPLHNQTNFPCTKTKDGQPSFFVAPKLPNTQTRPLQKQVFPGTLICFATQLPALPRTKKTAQHKCTVRFLFDLLQLKS